MWMSNTATTAMMVPIAVAVLEEMILTRRRHAASHKVPNTPPSPVHPEGVHLLQGQKNPDPEAPELTAASLGLDTEEGQTILSSPGLTAEEKGVCRGILLSICYSANVGGTGTLTGTGPNLVLRGVLNDFSEGRETEISFGSWMPFGISSMILCLVLSWCWLQLFFFGAKATFSCRSSKESASSEARINYLLGQQYERLGPIRFAEVSVFCWFLVLVLLWIFRSPSGMPGWQDLFTRGYISDASAAMFVALVLFAWPREMPDFYCLRSAEGKERVAVGRESLMTWSAMKRRFPFSIILLLGGGFALAAAVKTSGLSSLLAGSLGRYFNNLAPVWIAVIFTSAITFITEVSSNTATASIFLPVLGELARSTCTHPLAFMLPSTLGCSLAFMLPVSTPPNAIVYELKTKIVRIRDMASAGLMMNVLGISMSLLVANTVAVSLYDLDHWPAWAGNCTLPAHNSTLLA